VFNWQPEANFEDSEPNIASGKNKSLAVWSH